MANASTALRKSLKANKFNATGWTLVMIGNILTATCRRFDVSFSEALFVRRYVELEHSTTIEGCHAIFNENEHYGCVINWVR